MGERSAAYIWFDTEFTTLEYEQAQLLEVALVLTTPSLERLTAPREDFRAYVRLEDVTSVSPWVKEHLGALLTRCTGPDAEALPEVNQRLAAYLDRHLGAPASEIGKRPVLAGNSIQSDWILARRLLPSLPPRIHYRQLDVSTLKLLWQDTYGGEALDKENAVLVASNCPVPGLEPGAQAHDAYYDVLASLAEMNYYRQRLRRVGAAG